MKRSGIISNQNYFNYVPQIIIKALFSVLVIGLFLTSMYACAPGVYLKTEETKTDEITGTYTLILYGARYVSDIETLAIFDREGDGYDFEIYAPEFDYRVKKGMQAKEALKEAEKFVSFHRAFYRSVLSKILDDKGNSLGYELRPLYYPENFRYFDVLDVYYRLTGKKVIVRIRLRPEVERIISAEDEPDLFHEMPRLK